MTKLERLEVLFILRGKVNETIEALNKNGNVSFDETGLKFFDVYKQLLEQNIEIEYNESN